MKKIIKFLSLVLLVVVSGKFWVNAQTSQYADFPEAEYVVVYDFENYTLYITDISNGDFVVKNVGNYRLYVNDIDFGDNWTFLIKNPFILYYSFNDLYEDAFFYIADNQAYGDGYYVGYDYGYDLGLVDGYGNGYDYGYELGENDGYSAGRNDYGMHFTLPNEFGLEGWYDFQDGYDLGLDIGYDNGYSVGFNAGQSAGFDSSNWLLSIFLFIGTLLNIEFIPGLKIGYVVLIPVAIGTTRWVLGIFKGKP